MDGTDGDPNLFMSVEWRKVISSLRRKVTSSINDLYVGLFAIAVPFAAFLLLFLYDWLTGAADLRAVLPLLFLLSYLILAWSCVWVAMASIGVRGFSMLFCWPAWVGLMFASRGSVARIDASIFFRGRLHEVDESIIFFVDLIGFGAPILAAFGLACHLLYHVATKSQ